jgi:hypothetical protein
MSVCVDIACGNSFRKEYKSHRFCPACTSFRVRYRTAKKDELRRAEREEREKKVRERLGTLPAVDLCGLHDLGEVGPSPLYERPFGFGRRSNASDIDYNGGYSNSFDNAIRIIESVGEADPNKL